MKSRYISLANIAAGEELIAERVQTRANAANLIPPMLELIDDTARRAGLSERLKAVTRAMAGEGGSPSANAAEAVLRLISRKTS
jgi:lipid-A-disaccharide synthase